MSDFTGSNAEMVNIVHTSPSMYIVFSLLSTNAFVCQHHYCSYILEGQ